MIDFFCNIKMNKDGAKKLQQKVLYSINKLFYNSLNNELHKNNKILYDNFIIHYENMYLDFNGPKHLSNLEDKICDIIFDIYKVLNITINEHNITLRKEQLYTELRSKFNNNRIVYILDHNSFGEDAFIVSNEFIKSYDNPSKSYHEKTQNIIFKGLCYNYDRMIAYKSKMKNVLSYFKPKQQASTSANSIIILNNNDYFSYKLLKTHNELILLDEIGVDIENNKSILYIRHNNITKTISLEYLSNESGLTLFMKIVADIMNINIISDTNLIKKDIMKIITDVFNITVDRSLDRNIILTKEDFIYAIYDLKRSMDYLQVKAAISGNKNIDNTTFIFVSNDRLSIMYSIINNNPCIHTNGNIGTLYLPEGNLQQIGGLLFPQRNIKNDKNDFVDASISIDDIIKTHDINSLFIKFMIKYKRITKNITYFDYVVFLFFFDIFV